MVQGYSEGINNHCEVQVFDVSMEYTINNCGGTVVCTVLTPCSGRLYGRWACDKAGRAVGMG